jgi:hypothetical protein
MGVVKFGVPKEDVKWIRERLALDTFVEGGTFKGGTALEMAGLFDKVLTIEKSEAMYSEARQRLEPVGNVVQLLGDTRDHLADIVRHSDNVLFWLDAHWSGGKTYGEGDECPLLEELRIIFESSVSNYVVLVDDARLFLAPPPSPHKLESWPTIDQVCERVPRGFEVLVYEDVLYLVPTRLEMRRYFQHKTTSDWKSRQADGSGKMSLVKRAMSRLASGWAR